MLTPEALEGRSFGKYRVQHKAGEGGMACVYRAVQVDFESPVAIKVLFPEHARKELVRKRFAREARLQFRLRHPNIVRVLEMIEEEGLVGMVMDWVDGVDLEQHLRRLGRPLNNQEIMELFVPILDAVGYAHQHQVVHRDLKPSNIVLEQNGKRLIPKVMDFGIAKSVEDEQVTSTGVFLGTPAFLAPEQVQDARKVDHRVDIYALGVCLFRAACGQLPFSQGDFMSIVAAHLMNKPPLMAELYAGVDSRLEPVVQKALEKNPALRFSSCEEFSEAIQAAFLNGLSLSSHNSHHSSSAFSGTPETLQTSPPTVPSMSGVYGLPSSDSWDAPTLGAALYNSADHPATLRQDVSVLQYAHASTPPLSAETPHAKPLASANEKNARRKKQRRIGRLLAGLTLGIALALGFSFTLLWLFPREPRSSRALPRKEQDSDTVVYGSRSRTPKTPNPALIGPPTRSTGPSPLVPNPATRSQPSPSELTVSPRLPSNQIKQRNPTPKQRSPLLKKVVAVASRRVPVSNGNDLFSQAAISSCQVCLKKRFYRPSKSSAIVGLPGVDTPSVPCSIRLLERLAKDCRRPCRADYRVLCVAYIHTLDVVLRGAKYRKDRKACREHFSYRATLSSLKKTYRHVKSLPAVRCLELKKYAK